MGMFSEIATESTIQAIVNALKTLFDAEHDPVVKDAYRKAILVCFRSFEWQTPAWARQMRDQLGGAR